MKAQVGDLHALRVDRANYLREVAGALREADRDRSGGGRCLGAEATEHAREPLALARVLGDGLDALASDFGLQLRRRSLRHDAAAVDDPDAVGQGVGLLEVLRGKEHGHALAGQPPHLIPQRGAALGVEPRGGLIEEQQPRVVHESEAEIEAALHPTRVAAYLAVGRVGQAHPLEQLSAARLALALADPVQGALQAHVLGAGEVGVERGLLQRGADRTSHGCALVGDVKTRHARGPGGRGKQRGEHHHGR